MHPDIFADNYLEFFPFCLHSVAMIGSCAPLLMLFIKLLATIRGSVGYSVMSKSNLARLAARRPDMLNVDSVTNLYVRCQHASLSNKRLRRLMGRNTHKQVDILKLKPLLFTAFI